MAPHPGTGTRAARASSGAILYWCLGIWPPADAVLKPSACRRPGAAMRKFKAEKGIGEPDLEPDSPMVFSFVCKAISSREEPLHDGPC